MRLQLFSWRYVTASHSFSFVELVYIYIYIKSFGLLNFSGEEIGCRDRSSCFNGIYPAWNKQLCSNSGTNNLFGVHFGIMSINIFFQKLNNKITFFFFVEKLFADEWDCI